MCVWRIYIKGYLLTYLLTIVWDYWHEIFYWQDALSVTQQRQIAEEISV